MRLLAQFDEVWLADFEFQALSGERPRVECLVAHELFSRRTIRLWEDDLYQLKAAPYSCKAESLFVGYFISAEMSCHLALGWPMPINVLDLFTEFIVLWNGRQFPFGKSLLGALATFNLPGVDAIEKKEMRDLALRGAPWTDDERAALLDYCENDVIALRILLPAMLSRIDLPRALLRGDYMKAVARMESTGIPLDAEMLSMLIQHWGEVQAQLIHRVDMDYWVFEGTSFRVDRWEQWLVLLCQILSEHSSLNCSVVIHHTTAWWRSHRATSRCTAGSARRHQSGRGGKRVAWTTPFGLTMAVLQLQTRQKTHGQHHGYRMAVEARPQTALILIPTQLFFGFLMELLNGMAAMRIVDELLQRSRGRQVAPIAFALLRLPTGRPLPQQPADMGLTLSRQTPGP